MISHRALPIDGPPAALHAEIVGACAGDEDAHRLLGQRQDVFRSSAGRAIRGPLGGRRRGVRPSRTILESAVGQRRTVRVHQAHGELDAEDARDRVVNARERHLAFVDQFLEILQYSAYGSVSMTMSMPALMDDSMSFL